MTDTRRAEIAKYEGAYRHPDYRMGGARLERAREELAGLTGSLLDVGCGRGEVLELARELGLAPLVGTEVVAELLGADVIYAEAHALPWPGPTFDTVTCFDVLEHLLPADTVPALVNLRRVARRRIVLTVADYAHSYRGVELHVNRRSYDEWQDLFAGIFATWTLERRADAGCSATFRLARVPL